MDFKKNQIYQLQQTKNSLYIKYQSIHLENAYCIKMQYSYKLNSYLAIFNNGNDALHSH